MAILPILGTGFLLGILHALDADHVVAVTAFISKGPHPRRAVGFCVRWGLGHMLPLLFLGSVAIGVGIAIPSRYGELAEVLVGGALILLGAWVLWDLAARRIHFHVHEHGGIRHAHLHSHAGAADHRHDHAATLVGIVHGLAGTASVFVLVPVTLMGHLGLAILYILAFSLAVIAAMGLFGYCAGTTFEVLAARGVRAYRWAKGLTGTASLALGVVWIAKHW